MHVQTTTARRAIAGAALVLAAGVAAGCGGSSDESGQASTQAAQTTATAAQPASADLAGVKEYLLEHTNLLTGFTTEFQAAAAEYYALAEAAGFDYEALWAESGDEVAPILQQLKDGWVEGNPYYERVEGVVAGTPSLSEYDVILDAGSSAAEDPESAVPFDLTLPDGTVLKQPGNLFNLTEGALWGTLPDELGHPVDARDLDGDGQEPSARCCPTPACSSPRPRPSIATRASSTRDARPGSRPTRMRSPPWS